MSALTLHVVAAWALVALAAALCVWGLVRPRESNAWRQALALAHTLVVATGALGLVLLATGHHPHDHLHTRVYGPFMVVTLVAAWGFRTPDSRTNVRVFAIAMGFVAALGVRALTTG